MNAPPADFPEPIFVGGPGRSGTHPMGRLIEAHPRYHRIRTEARFHASPGGLPDLVAGRTDMESFLGRMRGPWWLRGWGQRQGLQRLVDEDEREAALRAFEADFERDELAASGALIRAFMDAPAAREGKPAWVELTGQTIEHAPFLVGLLPNARFINMVRDGRAVVAGMLRKVDMTDDPMKALEKWESMVRESDAGIRSLPPERLLTVHLDDFVAHDREATLERVIDFLCLDDDRPVREFFVEHISAEAAHVGAWRERMAPPDARRVDRRYRRLVRRLRRDGVEWTPAPRR